MMKSASAVKLGVNIDHIATLRQARRSLEPDLVAAAAVCRQGGADMIVCHLRQDRRHIQDADLFNLCAAKGRIHLELSAVPEMVAVALKARPASVCLVPESPREVSTRGGLNLRKQAKAVGRAVEKLKKAHVATSLFIDPEAASVRLAKSLGADMVELCTSAYAEAEGRTRRAAELERLELAGYLVAEMGMTLHAGHALHYHNVRPIARIPHMAALNIGFAVVSRAMFVGLKTAVLEMKLLLS